MSTEQFDQQTRLNSLKDLGVNFPEDFQALQRSPLEQAKEKLVQLKERVKTNYRRLIKELHPDQNGGDEEKTKRFKAITYEYNELCKLEVHPPRPMPAMMPMGIPFWNGTSSATTGTGTGATFHVFIVQNGHGFGVRRG
jgi:hypothetical protein